MTIPLKVLNRLRKGNDVAARIIPSNPSNVAWVYVVPIEDPQIGEIVSHSGFESKIEHLAPGDPIWGFGIRYIEVRAEIAEDFSSGRNDLLEPLEEHQRFIARDETELEQILSRWLDDFLSLHIPSDVGYYFEGDFDHFVHPVNARQEGDNTHMGYVIHQIQSYFFVPHTNLEEMFQAVRTLTSSEEKFAFLNYDQINQATTLGDLLSEWRWTPDFDEEGNLVELNFTGEKYGDEEDLFQVMAPFVGEESSVQFLGEDGAVWRWVFLEGTIIYQQGRLLFESL